MTETEAQQPFLSESILEFVRAARFATIATLDPDGSPRQAVVWYLLDSDEIVINSRVGRRWPSNLLRDPRISISVAEPRVRWIGLTGIARAITDQATAQADIAAMAHRYDGDGPEVERLIREEFQRQERISFRIRPLTVYDHVE